MCRWRSGGFKIALLGSLVLAGRAAASDPDDAPAPTPRPGWQTTTVWDKLFSSDKPATPRPPTPSADRDRDRDQDRDPAPAPHASRDRDREPSRRPVLAPARLTEAEDAATDRDREEKAYLRRVAVCLKLHEIAQANKDEELEKKAQQLEERIWAVYSEHTSRRSSGDDGQDGDEKMLQKHPTGTRPTSPAHAANGPDRAGRGALQEDNP